jgi:hypothetical protein
MGRLVGRDRRYIKGQKYTLLSRQENLTLDGRKAFSDSPYARARLLMEQPLKRRRCAEQGLVGEANQQHQFRN